MWWRQISQKSCPKETFAIYLTRLWTLVLSRRGLDNFLIDESLAIEAVVNLCGAFVNFPALCVWGKNVILDGKRNFRSYFVVLSLGEILGRFLKLGNSLQIWRWSFFETAESTHLTLIPHFLKVMQSNSHFIKLLCWVICVKLPWRASIILGCSTTWTFQDCWFIEEDYAYCT